MGECVAGEAKAGRNGGGRGEVGSAASLGTTGLLVVHNVAITGALQITVWIV